jgi:deoxyxylulose-5-phosphate synthase
MAPDENELRRMMLTAVQHDGPIAFRYPAERPSAAFDTVPAPIPIEKPRFSAKAPMWSFWR